MMKDKRALISGIMSGCIAGALMDVYRRPHMANIIPQSSLSVFWPVACTIVFLVPPGLVSAFARRRWFVWGLMPTLVIYLWLAGYEIRFHDFPAADRPRFLSLSLPFMCLLAWLVSSGVVSLIRLIIVKRKSGNGKPQYSSVDVEETVWPPPPNTRW